MINKLTGLVLFPLFPFMMLFDLHVCKENNIRWTWKKSIEVCWRSWVKAYWRDKK